MRARLSLVVVVLLVATTACGGAQRIVGGEQICTDIGCESQVTVSVSGVALNGKPGVIRAEVCFDGTCDHQRIRERADGSSSGRQGSRINVFEDGGQTIVSLRLPEGAYDETTKHQVSARISINDEEPVTIEREVTLERGQPNGPNCEPVCWQATIEA